MLNGKLEKATHNPADRSHFPAFRVLTHQDHGPAVATDPGNGPYLRIGAMAIKFNRRGFDAWLLQRSHCRRNAPSLN
jgi:hypothetical protein